MYYSDNKNFAFTLAEVLITLGIIGIVAALTIPTIVNNYKKKVTVTRLKRFYTIMNQAILMDQNSENTFYEDYKFPADTVRNSQNTLDWYNNHLNRYVKSTETKVYNSTFISVGLNDGSGFTSYIPSTSSMHFFFCVEYKYCKNSENFDGKNSFLFTLTLGKLYTSTASYYNLDRDKLLSLCKYGNSDNANVSSVGRRHACTRLIEFDGWEIKDDYPWEQTILEN